MDNIQYSDLLMYTKKIKTQKKQGNTNNDFEIYYIWYNNKTNYTVLYYLCPIIYILLCRVHAYFFMIKQNYCLAVVNYVVVFCFCVQR